MHECLALAAPRAMLVITALNDYKYTLDDADVLRAGFEDMYANVRQVYALYGQQDRLRWEFHTLGHGFELGQRDHAYAFIDEILRSDCE